MLFTLTFHLCWLTWKWCCYVRHSDLILFCLSFNPFNLFFFKSHSLLFIFCVSIISHFFWVFLLFSFPPAPHSTFVSPKMSFWQKHNRIVTWTQLWHVTWTFDFCPTKIRSIKLTITIKLHNGWHSKASLNHCCVNLDWFRDLPLMRMYWVENFLSFFLFSKWK